LLFIYSILVIGILIAIGVVPSAIVYRYASVTSQARETGIAETETAGVPLTVEARPFVTASAQAAIPIFEEASHWPIILDEEFDSFTNIWDTGPILNGLLKGNRSISDGWYHIDLEPTHTYNSAKEYNYWEIPQTDEYADFYVTTEVLIRWSLAANLYFGIVFRYVDTENMYVFMVDGEGNFRVDRIYEGERIILMDWKYHTAFEYHEFNEIEVVALGDHFWFFINDQYAADYVDGYIPLGQVGIGMGMNTRMDFDTNYKVDSFSLRVPAQYP
jgi:hypothetical protein